MARSEPLNLGPGPCKEGVAIDSICHHEISRCLESAAMSRGSIWAAGSIGCVRRQVPTGGCGSFDHDSGSCTPWRSGLVCSRTYWVPLYELLESRAASMPATSAGCRDARPQDSPQWLAVGCCRGRFGHPAHAARALQRLVSQRLSVDAAAASDRGDGDGDHPGDREREPAQCIGAAMPFVEYLSGIGGCRISTRREIAIAATTARLQAEVRPWRPSGGAASRTRARRCTALDLTRVDGAAHPDRGWTCRLSLREALRVRFW